MPWGVAAAVAGAATSAALAPSSSGGSGGGGSPNYYVPVGLGAADQSWLYQSGNQQNTQNLIQQNLPYYAQSLQQGLNAGNVYGPGYQERANVASQQYGGLAQQAQGQANLDFATQQGLLGAGQQVYQTAFDPQSALYNRSVQQLQDQTGATNSMYGLGSSAAGAGVANQALGNFNIDWQNQQLQRQLQGLQGYGSAAGVAGQYGQAGMSNAAAVPGYTLQQGEIPYNTAQNLAGLPGSLAAQYATQIQQGPLSSSLALNAAAIPYLNYGQGAQQIPYQSQQQGAGAAGALLSQGISGIGNNPQVQNAIGGLFGGNPAQGYFGSTQSPGNYAGTGYGGYGMGSGGDYYSGGGNSYGFTM
jgi:hypothetical protein